MTNIDNEYISLIGEATGEQIRSLGPCLIDQAFIGLFSQVWLGLPEGRRNLGSFSSLIRDKFEEHLKLFEASLEMFEDTAGSNSHSKSDTQPESH